jgi:hypothetical protein
MRKEEGDRSRLVAARCDDIAHIEEQAGVMRDVVRELHKTQASAFESAACMFLAFAETIQRHTILECCHTAADIFQVRLVMPNYLENANSTDDDDDITRTTLLATTPTLDAPAAGGSSNFAQQLLTDLVRNDICDLDIARIAFL